ncbi:MAG TPA: choice-of-anchor tandem repeat GloVer-containing protein [Candidatus Cybelea sp.]|jgi:uncharacterized repeat protein (TIGR03803 family)
MTKFQLLIVTFTLIVIPNVLAGCGAGSSAAIPGGIGPKALDQLGGGTYRTIYRFKGHRGGVGPSGQLIAIGGVLYGTTPFGGLGYGYGTIFSLTTSGERHVLYDFKGLSDGIEPYGGLVSLGGVLYGTTIAGGMHCPGESEFTGCGTVFAITLSGQEHVIYRFKGGTDGVAPFGGLTWLDGKLYGTTSRGGFTSECPQIAYGQGCGTVFSVDTSGHERVLYRFRGNQDGAWPNPRLLALDGKLYGTTRSGGEGGSCDYYCGTLFAVTTSGNEKVLHRFGGGSDGSGPGPGLTAIGGALYGTTGSNGASGGCCGTVFKATTFGAESAIYNFKGPPDASAPNGMLVTDHGLLYGTASGGESCGYSDSGTIFAVSTAGAEHVEHTFSCKSQDEPAPGLLRLDRTLYGATFSGYGTIFAFTP